MPLPKNFEYLRAEGMPKMIQEAIKIYGVREISGSVDNQLIMSWATEFNIRDIYTHDEVPWCSLAHAIVAKRAGKEVPYKREKLLRAASWVDWEKPVIKGEEIAGDTLVFKRPGGHHVGIYVAESKTTFHVIGGNQSNMYRISELEKGRVIARRRPAYSIGKPAGAKKYFIDSSGHVSTNES